VHDTQLLFWDGKGGQAAQLRMPADGPGFRAAVDVSHRLQRVRL
jgi:hypothetical protein